MNNIVDQRPHVFGILGGAGPLVSARLEWDFLKEHQRRSGAWSDEDFPGVISVNCAIAGISDRGLEDVDAAGSSLRASMEALHGLGASTLVPACASLFPALGAPPEGAMLLNWIDFGARLAAGRGVLRVGVVGSDSARRDQVFSSVLSTVGVECVELDDGCQDKANALIAQGMRGYMTASNRQAVNQISAYLSHRGAQMVWWGYTELSFIPREWIGPSDIQSVPMIVEAMLTHLGAEDVALSKRALAVASGAVEITWRQASAMCARRRHTGQLGDPDTALDWYASHRAKP